jgi:hypothetical protein
MVMKYYLDFVIKNKLICGLIALSVAVHYYFLLKYSANIPVSDDYYDALRFLNNYTQTKSISQKFHILFSQNNEHRPAFNHLIFASMHALYGSLNFKVLMFIGDISTIGLIILLGTIYRRQGDAFFIFALIAIFLLNLQSWQSMFWAMTATSNYSVAFFALASISALLSKSNKGIYFAALFAFLTAFSMGNGLVIWPIGFLCILLADTRNRRFRLLFWSLAMAACIAVYFTGYVISPAMKSPMALVLSDGQWQKPIIWFLTFLGSCWVFESNNVVLAASAGAILLALCAPSFIFLKTRAPAVAYFIFFLLMSTAITTYSRFYSSDLTWALSSRYKIYSIYLSCILLITIYLWLSAKRPNQKLLKIFLLSIVVSHTIASYCTSLEPMRDEQRDVADSMRQWLLTKRESRFEFQWIPDGSFWIEDSIISKRWDPRELFPDSLYFHRVKNTNACTQKELEGNLPADMKRNIQAVAGEIAINDKPLIFDRIKYIIVCKDQRTYSADAIEPSRNIDGKLKFHYLKIDPIEKADSVLFKTNAGAVYKGIISQ